MTRVDGEDLVSEASQGWCGRVRRGDPTHGAFAISSFRLLLPYLVRATRSGINRVDRLLQGGRIVTLNITLLTPFAIYQSADFRLTDPLAGLPTFVWLVGGEAVVWAFRTFAWLGGD